MELGSAQPGGCPTAYVSGHRQAGTGQLIGGLEYTAFTGLSLELSSLDFCLFLSKGKIRFTFPLNKFCNAIKLQIQILRMCKYHTQGACTVNYDRAGIL